MDSLTKRTLSVLDEASSRLASKGLILNYRTKNQTNWDKIYMRAIVAIAAADYMLELTGYKAPLPDPEETRKVRNLLVETNAHANLLGTAQFVPTWRD